MNKTKQTNEKIKICFVALSAYPLLAGKSIKRIIGPDVHTTLLAKELLKHNFEITFITYSDGGAPIEYIDDIEIIKIYNTTYCLNILNIILKIFRIWNAMRKAKAHIYFHAGGVPGAVSPFCKLIRKKFIYEILSDALVNRELITRKIKEFKLSKFSLATFGNWLDIKLADAIIVLNEFQNEMLKKKFGKNGMMIKIPFPLSRRGKSEKAKPPIVLWVGSMAEVKQPELFVKLAEAIPEARLQMVGGHSGGNQELYNRIKESSKRISNFEYFGVIPLHKDNEYFSRASILVNTSMFEGFPHAFIQAWMHYVPVVSLNADPDGIICRHKMGFHSKTFDQLVEDVKTLLKDEDLRKQMGGNSRQYVENEHNITNLIREYLKVFEHLRRS